MQVADRVACRIFSVEALSIDILRIKLQLNGDGFSYMAGQYLDLVLPDGSKRSFSIANRLRQDRIIELHIRRLPGAHFIGNLLDIRHHGGELSVEGPFGDFYFRGWSLEHHSPAIFIAAGTGFSPFKAMIEELAEERTQEAIHLYWGSRIKGDLYLQDWVL